MRYQHTKFIQVVFGDQNGKEAHSGEGTKPASAKSEGYLFARNGKVH